MTEYNAFREWFVTDIRKGAYPFYFPQIDGLDKTINKVGKV